jgi:hypothetical protein
VKSQVPNVIHSLSKNVSRRLYAGAF